MKIQNKVIVVTGGGNGMGRAVVLNLVSKGASVAAVDINESALQETIELAGNQKDKLSTHLVNITDKEAVAALLPNARIESLHAPPDLQSCVPISLEHRSLFRWQ